MINQILTAVDFLARFMNAANIFTEEQIRNFKKHLSDLLTERYTGHWYPDQPCKGQGHRCIRINGRMREVTIQEAAKASGLKYEDLNLPLEITISVDPNDVSYRFGEQQGSWCTLATFDYDNVPTLSTDLKKTATTKSQVQVTQLSASSEDQANVRKSKSKHSAKHIYALRPNKKWGHHTRTFRSRDPLHSCYRIIPQHWLSPSPLHTTRHLLVTPLRFVNSFHRVPVYRY